MRDPIVQWIGNALALLGALVGTVAAYLWWVASTIPAVYDMDSMRGDLIAIGEANKLAALVTALSSILVATGEILRTAYRRGH